MKAIIVGASSGIGLEVAKLLLADGWHIGIAARREEALLELKKTAPERVEVMAIDITHPDAGERLLTLVRQLGGMDLYFHSSGIGKQNRTLEPDIELQTMDTNAIGFTRMIGTAYRYFAEQGKGHIAAITSIAGTKGLGPAPAYSATKRMQSHYLSALAQLARMEHIPIRFTDIRPGFIATDILNPDKHYPMLMSKEKAADHIMKALRRKKRVYTFDWRFRVASFIWSLTPRGIWERITWIKN
jgi:short-subunit dehydrogenase